MLRQLGVEKLPQTDLLFIPGVKNKKATNTN
jgi:hypothetical protein